MDDCYIGVEYYATNPPKPCGFGVMKNGKPVAYLSEEQVRIALARFDEMKAKREAANSCGHSVTSGDS